MRRFILILGIFTVAGLLQACGRDGFASVASEPYLHKVDTQLVSIVSGYEVEREFAGVVKANQTSDLGFELAGRIDRLLVNEGEAVSAGQLLAELDTSLLRSQGAELEAREDSLDSEINLAERNLERVEKLQRDGLASDRERDELLSRVQVLQASRREVRAASQANHLRLEKSRLVAPFTATIGRRNVDEGTVVDAGIPVFSLVEAGARELRVGIPPSLFPNMAAGQMVTVRNLNEQAEGRVLALGATVDQATRTRALRILVEAPWTPGELAYAQLRQQVTLEGGWIPESAVTEGLRGTWMVYVAIPQGDETAVLETRSVTVHHSSEGRLFVSGALSDSDLLVIHGLHRLAPRQVVRIGDSSSFAQLRLQQNLDGQD